MESHAYATGAHDKGVSFRMHPFAPGTIYQLSAYDTYEMKVRYFFRYFYYGLLSKC